MRPVAALWIVMAAVACRGGPFSTSFDYSRNMGLAVEKNGHICVYVRNAGLSVGQRLTLVAAARPQRVVETEIAGKGDDFCRDSTLDEPGVMHYLTRVTRGSAPALAGPAFAVIGFDGPWRFADDEVTADLEGGGQRDHFRSCTSAEGVHLTVWKGKPLEGARTWHRYFYLGYDVTADCTDADTRPDPR